MKNKLFPFLIAIAFTNNAMEDTYCIRPPTGSIKNCLTQYQVHFSHLATLLNTFNGYKDVAQTFSDLSIEIKTTLDAQEHKLLKTAFGISNKIHTQCGQAESVLLALLETNNNLDTNQRKTINALLEAINQDKSTINLCVNFQHFCEQRVRTFYTDLDY